MNRLRLWRRVLVLGGGLAALALSGVLAANPAYNYFSYGSCNVYGQSSFIWSPGNYAQSDTKYSSGTCTDTYHVHAYYWGSDSSWHYFEHETLVSPAHTSYSYWTDNVWGYHKYPASSGTTNTTNA